MPKIPAKVAQQQLWFRGNLRWKLNKAQLKIDNAFRKTNEQLFVANCSRGIGKTYWACCKAIEAALTCPLPFPKIFYASATKHDLKKYVITAFELILADCPSELRPTWNAGDLKFTFPTGAEIYLIGLDKRPDGGRGARADLYIFEEAGQIEKLDYLYGSVVSPMFITRTGARAILISTPSPTPAHPFKDFCDRAIARGSYIELPITANPMMDETARDKALAECLTESEKQREYFCQHVVDSNLAIVPEWESKYEIPVPTAPVERYGLLHKYVAMDLGTKVDLTAVIYGYYDKTREVLVIEAEDEMTGPAMTTIALKNLIVQRESELWGHEKPHKRVADNNNPLLVQDLGILHGLWFVPTGKSDLHSMVDSVRVMVKAGRIEVSTRCKKLLGCLRYAIWNKQRTVFGRSPLYGHFDHLAALIYLVRNLDNHINPFPLLPDGVTKRTHLIRPMATDPAELVKIKKIFGITDDTD